MLKNYKITLFLLLLAPLSPLTAQGFTEVSLASGINHQHRSAIEMGGGAAWFDMDRDGDEDLVMTGGLNPVALFRNDGNGHFADVTQSSGMVLSSPLQTMGVCTGDIDNDGYREVFFTSFMHQPSTLFYNNGNGTFTDITAAAGLIADSMFSSSAMFYDFDEDRDLDLYVGNYIKTLAVITDTNGTVIGFNHTCEPDHLYMNDGNNHFTEMGAAYGLADSGCALAVTVTHHNLSPAVYVANDFGEWNIPNQFFYDQGLGLPSYTNASQALGLDVPMYGMGIAQGDYDHDNDIDYYITNIGPNKLMNYNPMSGGWYHDTAAYAGVRSGTLMGLNTTGWGTAFIDYDNDSWQDLFTCNGQINVVPMIANVAKDPDKLYRNLGNGTFSDVTMAQGIADSGLGRGMIRGDYDLDGDDDILTMVIANDTGSTAHTKLWRNDNVNLNHWVNLRLEGTTHSSRDPYGAIVEVRQNFSQVSYEISGGGSHMSQNSSILHIGLGSNPSYTLFVTWPTGGLQQYDSLPADTTITLLEDSSKFLLGIPPFRELPGLKVYPNPANGEWSLKLEHTMSEMIEIEVLDMQGKRIIHRNASEVPAGSYSWLFDGESLPHSGAYLVRVRTDNGQVSKMLIKM